MAATTNLAGINVVDGVTPSQKATVAQFHNADNQSPGGTAYGMLTGGVAQLLNVANNIDRQRETGTDNISAIGIATGTQQLLSPMSTTLAASGAAGVTSLTLTATKFTNRGAAAWIQVGSVLFLEPGTTNQEAVVVIAVNYGTNVVTITGLGSGGSNTGTKLTHANAVSVTAGAYNQARDATAPDGSTGAGFAAGATYLFNSTLNAGSGGWEGERSAAGELDGATGTGTNIAAEYEWNAGGPLTNAGAISGLAFDRARNLQGKGNGTTTLNGSGAAGATSLVFNAVVGLQAGQQVRLDRNTGNEECAYVSSTYTPGTTTVTFQSALQFNHSNAATAEWDIFAPIGPGLTGFTPAGIGIEEEALFNPADGKYYIERSATSDAMAGANIVAECPALYNGTTFDRAKGTNGAAYVIPYASTVGGTSRNLFRNVAATGAAANIKGSAGTLYGLQIMNNQGASAFIQVFDAAPASINLGTTVPVMEYLVAANSQMNIPLPTQGIAFTTAITACSTTGELGGTGSAAGVHISAQWA